jgi:adenylate cyclase
VQERTGRDAEGTRCKGGNRAERKFLVRQLPSNLSGYPHQLIEQGYLVLPRGVRDAVEIRVRRSGKGPVLTVKQGRGKSRLEKEVPLPQRSAVQLWPLTQGRRVKKVRYQIPYRGLTIELDVYQANARGLAVAEVEFPSRAASRRFHPPDWFGTEVTGRHRFANSQLAVTGWKRGSSRKA